MKFLLYTREVSQQLISNRIIPASFDSSLETKFIIHGFLQDGSREWILRMKNAFLRLSRFNVITVDYESSVSYQRAVANSQVVGAEIARLINKLNNKTGADISNFHLIGHSLGKLK